MFLIRRVINICLIFSSVGWILLVVYGIQVIWTALPRRRNFITAGVVLLLILGCYRTFLRNNDWTSRETLLRYTLYHYVKLDYTLYIHFFYNNLYDYPFKSWKEHFRIKSKF